MELSNFITKEQFCDVEDSQLSKVLADVWDLNQVGNRRLFSLLPDDLMSRSSSGSRLWSDKSIAKLIGDPVEEAREFVASLRLQIEVAMPLVKGEVDEVPYESGYMWNYIQSDGLMCIEINYATGALSRILVTPT